MPPLYTAALFDLDNTLWDGDAAIRTTGRLLHETFPTVRVAASASHPSAGETKRGRSAILSLGLRPDGVCGPEVCLPENSNGACADARLRHRWRPMGR